MVRKDDKFEENSQTKICCPHEDLIKQLELGFPDGPLPHRAYHQAAIDSAKAQEKFWSDLNTDLKKKGIYAILWILVGLLVVNIFGPDELRVLLKLIN